jgi:hypothetical protein
MTCGSTSRCVAGGCNTTEAEWMRGWVGSGWNTPHTHAHARTHARSHARAHSTHIGCACACAAVLAGACMGLKSRRVQICCWWCGQTTGRSRFPHPVALCLVKCPCASSSVSVLFSLFLFASPSPSSSSSSWLALLQGGPLRFVAEDKCLVVGPGPDGNPFLHFRPCGAPVEQGKGWTPLQANWRRIVEPTAFRQVGGWVSGWVGGCVVGGCVVVPRVLRTCVRFHWVGGLVGGYLA